LRAEALGKLGAVNFQARTLWIDGGYESDIVEPYVSSEHSLRIDTRFCLGCMRMPLQAGFRPEDRHDGTRITEYDGFFLFEQVPYGTYGLRVAADSAQVLGVERELARHIGLSRDEDIVRVGVVRLVSAIIARAPADPATASDGQSAVLAKR
jgi:hypothetical protein